MIATLHNFVVLGIAIYSRPSTTKLCRVAIKDCDQRSWLGVAIKDCYLLTNVNKLAVDHKTIISAVAKS